MRYRLTTPTNISYLSVNKVVSPKWADLILSTNIPDSETDILVLNSLYVKTC